MPLDSQIFFLFVMSGFITIWSFRYFTKSKKTAEFEYLGLSAFWGVVMLMLWSLIPWLGEEKKKELVSSAFLGGVVLAFIGFMAGCAAAHISRTKVFRRIVDFYSPK